MNLCQACTLSWITLTPSPAHTLHHQLTRGPAALLTAQQQLPLPLPLLPSTAQGSQMQSGLGVQDSVISQLLVAARAQQRQQEAAARILHSQQTPLLQQQTQLRQTRLHSSTQPRLLMQTPPSRPQQHQPTRHQHQHQTPQQPSPQQPLAPPLIGRQPWKQQSRTWQLWQHTHTRCLVSAGPLMAPALRKRSLMRPSGWQG